MTIRSFQPEDLGQVLSLFYHTVHEVNARDYTQKQLDAWAPRETDANAWLERLNFTEAIVAVRDGGIAGFGNLESPGVLDCLYVRAGEQGHGVGGALLHTLEESAWKQGSNRLTAEVSITARPFFLYHGYQELRAQQVERRGVSMKNFVMSRDLGE